MSHSVGFDKEDLNPAEGNGDAKETAHTFDSPPTYQADEHGQHHVQADRLARKLTARQVQLIAIGGTIGTGLFLGTGNSLATGGPASMLICYVVVGIIVFFTMLALGEMAAFMPIAGVSCVSCSSNPISRY